jgi:hypothetical protein
MEGRGWIIFVNFVFHLLLLQFCGQNVEGRTVESFSFFKTSSQKFSISYGTKGCAITIAQFFIFQSTFYKEVFLVANWYRAFKEFVFHLISIHLKSFSLLFASFELDCMLQVGRV